VEPEEYVEIVEIIELVEIVEPEAPVLVLQRESIEIPNLPAPEPVYIPTVVLQAEANVEPIHQAPAAPAGRTNPQTDDDHSIVGLAVSGVGLISSAFLVLWLRKRQKTDSF